MNTANEAGRSRPGRFFPGFLVLLLASLVSIGHATAEPCATNVPFAFTRIAAGTNRWVSISWESCTNFVFGVFATENLSVTNGWSAQAWLSGATGTTSWTDTNAPSAPARFYKVRRLTQAGDDDGDTIPNGWEVAHGLNPLDPTDASQPSTNPWAHGLTNLQVYQNPSVLIADNYSTLGDGISDWWKVKYSFSLTDPGVATADTDGDAYINLQEYQCDTDPRNPASYPPPWANITAPSVVCAGSTGNKASVPGLLTTLWQFTGGVDGAHPRSALAQGSDGHFYGTTDGGGASGRGAVFKISSEGTLTTLYQFVCDDNDTCPNGSHPNALVQGSDGYFYGTTRGGGDDAGTVFRINSTGTLTTLWHFSGGTDGAAPCAGLVQGSDGYFYGTTAGGGTNHWGSVFKISSAGTLTTLWSFSGDADGMYPKAGLVQGTDGWFYGTTTGGGSNTYGYGTVFNISSTGTLTALWQFSGGADGLEPQAELVQGNDGYFYGTTLRTVFKISSAGTLTTLHDFAAPDGWFLVAGLVQGRDGYFYGTTKWGGANNLGTVFKISSAGTLTTLHEFGGGSDGGSPLAGLVQSSDGYLYGTTAAGGTNGAGTVFKIGPQISGWSINNGTITAGQDSTNITWTAGTSGTVTICVMGTNTTGCNISCTNVAIIGPAVTSSPTSQTVCAGGSVTFSVTAGTAGPSCTSPSWMWTSNGWMKVGSGGFGANIPATLGANQQAAAAVGVSAARPEAARFRPDKILVKPKKSVQTDQLTSYHAVIGAGVERTFSGIGNLQVVKLPPGVSVQQAIDHYKSSGLVEYAEPDYELHTCVAPNDPAYTNGWLWSLNNNGLLSGEGGSGCTLGADIDAADAWNTRTSADPIVVAVIDTGVWYTHEDLASNMWVNPCVNCPVDGVVYSNDVHGINAITGTGDPLDDNGHGTHVAGIIGAVGNNGKGVAGVAWNIRIMACKLFAANGSNDTAGAIACIDYAIHKGAKVINASWGGPAYDQALHDAIAAARDADVVLVAAAGNFDSPPDNDQFPIYPASYRLANVVAVTATDCRDNLLEGSHYGATSVALGAPGWEIYSTWNGSDNDYGFHSGTSMAAPHVSGAFALLRAQFPSLNYSNAVAALLATVDPIPSLAGKTITGGRLNLQKLLTYYNPLGYQWRKNGVSISGATRPSYTILSAGTGDAGSYDVVVTNSCGCSIITTNATLTVTGCP